MIDFAKESIALYEQVGSRVGIAEACSELGRIETRRGNVAEARGLLIKSRDTYGKIGARKMEKKVQGWIDELPSE